MVARARAAIGRWRALACLAILMLAGCAGEDTAGTSTATSGGAQRGAGAEAKAKPQRAGEEARAKKRQVQKQDGSGRSTPAPEPAGPPPTRSGPLPNEGSKKAAPGVPTAKGGDNSIQEYGIEATSSARVDATRTLQAYLDARATREWARACAHLSTSIKEEVLRFLSGAAKSDSSEPPDCAEIMRRLSARVPQSALRKAASIRVLSMRIEAEQAFLIYKGGEGVPLAIPMAREQGEWRVAAIDGSALVI